MENKIYQGSLFRSSIPLMSCSIFKEQYMAWKKNIGGIRSGWLTPFLEKKSCFPSVPKDSKLFEVGTKEDTKETHKERPSGLASASHQVGFEENYKRKLCAWDTAGARGGEYNGGMSWRQGACAATSCHQLSPTPAADHLGCALTHFQLLCPP